MRRARLTIATALLLSLSACMDRALGPEQSAPKVSRILVPGDCLSDGVTCAPPDLPGPGPTYTGTYFSDERVDVLYEAPGDPSPGAPGIWLGANTTPTTCFADLNRNVLDRDADWLDDGCEYRIAYAFRPMMVFSPDDGCADGEPYWAAKYFNLSGNVRLAFMPSYYLDCGPGNNALGVGAGHTGDSEFIMVDVIFNATTKHWELNYMFLSAHALSNADRSRWMVKNDVEYSLRRYAHPRVYVADKKHSNYPSAAVCNQTAIGDTCQPLVTVRFPVTPSHNVGSRVVDLVGCVPSEKQYAVSGRSECFYTRRSFNGWQNNNQSGATPYSDILRSQLFEDSCYNGYILYIYQCYGTTDSGPASAPPQSLAVTVSGPRSMQFWGYGSFSASVAGATGSVQYQWLVDDQLYTTGASTITIWAPTYATESFRVSVVATDASGASARAEKLVLLY